MQESLEETSRLLPADAESAVVLEPRDGAFDGPSAAVAAEVSVLREILGASVRPVRRDQVRALAGELIVQRVAVVRLVADDAAGRHAGEHELKEALHQRALVRRGRGPVDRHRQPAGVDEHHDFHALSGLGDADPIPAALGFAERRVDEALLSQR